MLDRESILEKVRNGVANQIETDREKRNSKDDISGNKIIIKIYTKIILNY